MSKFKEDLRKEEVLGVFLDKIYKKLNIALTRVSDSAMQRQGIDLIYSHADETVHIDEKAQLHYLNRDLPTFTFELSYTKGTLPRQGWLFDPDKKTDYYFLVTGILAKNKELTHASNITGCKITAVNRYKLINHLKTLGLTPEKLAFYDSELRENRQFGQHLIEELDPKNGSLHFTEHLQENPINLKLRLDYLLEAKVAKRIYPIG
ncbi:MAG: hypothetical protein ACFCUL_01135 [Flavobacteriaceae bacterium]